MVTYEPILSLLVAGTGRVTLSGLLFLLGREGRGREEGRREGGESRRGGGGGREGKRVEEGEGEGGRGRE